MTWLIVYFELHQQVGLYIIAQGENVLVKFDKTIFRIKLQRSVIFFPNAQPNPINVSLFCDFYRFVKQQLTHFFPVKGLQYVDSVNF